MFLSKYKTKSLVGTDKEFNTIRSHLSVAHAAATIIQRNWRWKHLLYSVRFWNNQRRVSSRILQRWWRQTAELLKEDLEEAAMKNKKKCCFRLLPPGCGWMTRLRCPGVP